MSHHVEIVRYRTADAGEEFIAKRQAAVLEIKEHHPGLVAVPVLAVHDDGTVTEVWVYESEAAAAKANAEAEGLPAFSAYGELLSDVDVVEGTMPVSAADPLV